MKVCSNGPGHMTKMAATSIYGKNPLKNLLLQNQKTDDLVYLKYLYCRYECVQQLNIKETNCYGWTNGYTYRQCEDSIPSTNKVCRRYNNSVDPDHKSSLRIRLNIFIPHIFYILEQKFRIRTEANSS